VKTGNDIVALDKLSWRARSLHPGYLDKIFTPAEKIQISSTNHPAYTLAMYWAAKESAYKIYHQHTHNRYFAPKDFEVSFFQSIHTTQIRVCSFQIQTPIGYLHTRLERHKKYIHAVTRDFSSLNHFYLFSDAFQLPFSSRHNQSRFIKSQVLKKLSQLPVYQNHPLQIVTDPHGIPRILNGNDYLPISLSISHDGNWGGYSMVLPQERKK